MLCIFSYYSHEIVRLAVEDVLAMTSIFISVLHRSRLTDMVDIAMFRTTFLKRRWFNSMPNFPNLVLTDMLDSVFYGKHWIPRRCLVACWLLQCNPHITAEHFWCFRLGIFMSLEVNRAFQKSTTIKTNRKHNFNRKTTNTIWWFSSSLVAPVFHLDTGYKAQYNDLIS